MQCPRLTLLVLPEGCPPPAPGREQVWEPPPRWGRGWDVSSRAPWALLQVIRPPQVTLTQTPMVALRQPHSRIVLTTPQQVQLSQLQPGEGRRPGRSPQGPVSLLFNCGGTHVTQTWPL